ncbi:MAG: PPC domain-containing DNA-binding protein [Deltaproteobacteria bacterium]
MKKLIAVLIFALALPLAAQETRREEVLSTGDRAQDTRPNSNQVPDVSAIHAHLERIVVLRFKHNTDLLAGLKEMVKQEKIKNAVILSGFGSVRNFQVHQVGNRDLPPKDVFIKNPSAPADILGMSGFVMDGRVHPHITLANGDKAFGGHLEPDTTVFTFAVVTLGVLDDGIDFTKIDDWNYR